MWTSTAAEHILAFPAMPTCRTCISTTMRKFLLCSSLSAFSMPCSSIATDITNDCMQHLCDCRFDLQTRNRGNILPSRCALVSCKLHLNPSLSARCWLPLRDACEAILENKQKLREGTWFIFSKRKSLRKVPGAWIHWSLEGMRRISLVLSGIHVHADCQGWRKSTATEFISVPAAFAKSLSHWLSFIIRSWAKLISEFCTRHASSAAWTRSWTEKDKKWGYNKHPFASVAQNRKCIF